MSVIVKQLIRLRRTLSGQLEDLESGEVKVLVLIDGGRTDEDATHERIEQLQSCLRIIDTALEQILQSAVLEPVAHATRQSQFSEFRHRTL